MKILITPVLALLIGYLLNSIKMPIPFMLGGIFAALIGRFTKLFPVVWKKEIRSLGLVVVGYGVGAYVTAEIVDQCRQQVAGIVGATFVAVIIALAIAIYMWKHDGADLQSCIMGLLPGGFIQMISMADEDKRVDPNIVAVLQSLRLITIIVMVTILVKQLLHAQVKNDVVSMAVTDGISFWLLLPFAIVMGYLFARWRISNPYLMGAVFLAALVSVFVGKVNSAPGHLMYLAQLSVGIYTGMGLDVERLKKLKALLPVTFGGIFLMLAASIGVAFLLSDLYGFTIVTAFLAMAPGGMGEMCLAAMSMGEDVAVVLTYQVFRFLFINIAGPWGIKKYFGEPVN